VFPEEDDEDDDEGDEDEELEDDELEDESEEEDGALAGGDEESFEARDLQESLTRVAPEWPPESPSRTTCSTLRCQLNLS
jgi:hypothetical protein